MGLKESVRKLWDKFGITIVLTILYSLALYQIVAIAVRFYEIVRYQQMFGSDIYSFGISMILFVFFAAVGDAIDRKYPGNMPFEERSNQSKAS